MAESPAELTHARDYAAIAHEFALEASKDRYGKKHCKWVRLAAKRHLADLKKQRLKKFGYVFDEWYGNDICDFVEKFEHVEGDWETKTITLEPAQIFILVCVFGWRRKDNGLRRFTVVYIEMARKGAKSTLTAPICLYCLACEGELGPQVIIGATTGKQTLKVFDPAKGMTDGSPDFREAFGVETWAHSITCSTTGGYIQTINAKSSTQDGWNPYVCVLDELHAHKDRGLYDVMRSSLGARKSPLLWIITTAGYNVAGVCYEQHKLVERILQNTVQADHYFGIIFTLDEKDDIFDESKWIKANPLIGITPSWESMREYAVEAKNSPESLGEFRTKRLNKWTNAKGAWLNIERWKKCNGKVDLSTMEGAEIYAGLDLSSVSDTTAFVMVWLHEGRLQVYCRIYCPAATLERRTQEETVPYQAWYDNGFLLSTPGDAVDYGFIEEDIDDHLAKYNIREIGFDRWNSSSLVANLLEKEAPMVEMAQGAKTFNSPMDELERVILEKELDHGGHPVLEWMASNVVAKKDENDNKKPDRKNSADKIDGIVAMLMGLGRLLVSDDDGESVYETEDLLVL